VTKLYDTDRSTQIAIKPTKQFLQDLNLIMASHHLSASEIIRGSVSAQAEAIRRDLCEAGRIE